MQSPKSETAFFVKTIDNDAARRPALLLLQPAKPLPALPLRSAAPPPIRSCSRRSRCPPCPCGRQRRRPFALAAGEAAARPALAVGSAAAHSLLQPAKPLPALPARSCRRQGASASLPGGPARGAACPPRTGSGIFGAERLLAFPLLADCPAGPSRKTTPSEDPKIPLFSM